MVILGDQYSAVTRQNPLILISKIIQENYSDLSDTVIRLITLHRLVYVSDVQSLIAKSTLQ